MSVKPRANTSETGVDSVRIVKYVWNKGSIVGPSWKIPFIGPFLESVNPKMEKYIEKFNSGELSCVSVFHKYDAKTNSPKQHELTLCLQIRGHRFVQRYGTQSLQFP